MNDRSKSSTRSGYASSCQRCQSNVLVLRASRLQDLHLGPGGIEDREVRGLGFRAYKVKV